MQDKLADMCFPDDVGSRIGDGLHTSKRQQQPIGTSVYIAPGCLARSYSANQVLLDRTVVTCSTNGCATQNLRPLSGSHSAPLPALAHNKSVRSSIKHLNIHSSDGARAPGARGPSCLGHRTGGCRPHQRHTLEVLIEEQTTDTHSMQSPFAADCASYMDGQRSTASPVASADATCCGAAYAASQRYSSCCTNNDSSSSCDGIRGATLSGSSPPEPSSFSFTSSCPGPRMPCNCWPPPQQQQHLAPSTPAAASAGAGYGMQLAGDGTRLAMLDMLQLGSDLAATAGAADTAGLASNSRCSCAYSAPMCSTGYTLQQQQYAVPLATSGVDAVAAQAAAKADLAYADSLAYSMMCDDFDSASDLLDLSVYMARHQQLQLQHQQCISAAASAAFYGSAAASAAPGCSAGHDQLLASAAELASHGGLSRYATAKLQELLEVQRLQMEIQSELLQLLTVA